MADWIIVAIRKHIASDEPLPGAGEAVGVNKPADLGVVITALQVVESRLLGMGVAGRTFLLVFSQREEALFAPEFKPFKRSVVM